MANLLNCKYFNNSDKLQIVRIASYPSWLERVIAPGQVVEFQSTKSSYLEVYKYESITMILADKIACYKLCQ